MITDNQGLESSELMSNHRPKLLHRQEAARSI